jgi:2-oxoglutarate ferredoxin oxidoreductase subunit alpha
MAKQAEIEENEIRFRELMLQDAEIVVIAFGTAGRIAQSAIKTAREEGVRVGLLRPISLYPFPYERVHQLGDKVKEILVVEMNSGQMLEDVRIGIEGRVPISFYGRPGGVVPMPDEILEEIRKVHSRSSPSK